MLEQYFPNITVKKKKKNIFEIIESISSRTVKTFSAVVSQLALGKLHFSR